MFVYLSKKIAIPNGSAMCSISWSPNGGWIACGGENGLLKVLQLASGTSQAPGGNLTSNQTLEGHSGDVMVVTWNAVHQKLTTSDQAGLIIVWMMHKQMWFEEMINNRNKSVVRHMKWAPDGNKICIAYEDGAVIVGSVDGNRLWGKEIGLELALVEWSPDGGLLLFVNTKGESHVFDGNGNAISKMPLKAAEGSLGVTKIVGIEWFASDDGDAEEGGRVLAIGLDSGKLQLMHNHVDEAPLVVDTGISMTSLHWNPAGNMLAVAGMTTMVVERHSKKVGVVQFYTSSGLFIRQLRIPGASKSSSLKDFSWEGSGNRLAIAVDSSIYFANIRHSHHWTYFCSTLVFSYRRPGKAEHRVVFWDTSSNFQHTKSFKHLLGIQGSTTFCVVATRGEGASECILHLCNSIGSPVATKYVSILPQHLAISPTHVVAASHASVYVWQYRVMRLEGGAGSGTDISGELKDTSTETLFGIDRGPSMGTRNVEGYIAASDETADGISAICTSAASLVIGRSSGRALRYSLVDLSLESQHQLNCQPAKLALNCNGTRLAVIDSIDSLTLYDVSEEAGPSTPSGSQIPGLECKDAWDVRWAEDSPDMFAVMERSRMYIYNGLQPEEPIGSAGYICHFSDLQITAALLDDLVQDPEEVSRDKLLVLETRGVRDTMTLLKAEGAKLEDAFALVDASPHPRLWRLLAEKALEMRNWAMADKAYVLCGDYAGIQLVKHLQRLDDPQKQQAETLTHLKRFDEAEERYLAMDRADLAIDMRSRLGDWYRVEKLQLRAQASDEDLVRTRNHIGDYCADRHRWNKALDFYMQARNSSQLARCFYKLEDFQGLERLVDVLAEGTPLLDTIGSMLESVGLCTAAVNAYLKAGGVKPSGGAGAGGSSSGGGGGGLSAVAEEEAEGGAGAGGGEEMGTQARVAVKRSIDCCILLNHWDLAMDLAYTHSFPQTQALLVQRAAQLLRENDKLHAIHLFRKAHHHGEAARLLTEIAKDAAAVKKDARLLKKIYILAALEVDRNREKLQAQGVEGTLATLAGATTAHPMATQTAATLAGLLTKEGVGAEPGGDMGFLEHAWRGAEAYHLLLLAHRQLYVQQPQAALRTALNLTRYDDILDPQQVYCFLALVAFHSQYYGQCSRAFRSLESMPSIPAEKRQAYSALATTIFVKHKPIDPRELREMKGRDSGSGTLAQMLSGLEGGRTVVCVASGRQIRPEQGDQVQRCARCRHQMLLAESRSLSCCPLCHAPLVTRSSSLPRSPLSSTSPAIRVAA